MGCYRYNALPKLLAHEVERAHLVSVSRHRAAKDVWLGWTGRVVNLDKEKGFRLMILYSTGLDFLTGKGCSPQVGHGEKAVKANVCSEYGFF